MPPAHRQVQPETLAWEIQGGGVKGMEEIKCKYCIQKIDQAKELSFTFSTHLQGGYKAFHHKCQIEELSQFPGLVEAGIVEYVKKGYL